MVDDIIKDAKIANSYEDATALNIFTKINLTIDSDFTYHYNVFYIKKILTYKGKKRYSDVKINYFPAYQTVDINKSFSIDTHNQRIEIPENMIYNLDTQTAMYSPEFINEKQKIINFPKIEPGYYIVFDYTITDTRKRVVNGVEHLMESNPYLHKEFTITCPKDMKLNTYYPKDKGIKFSSKNEDGKKIMTWEVEDSPLIKDEPSQPSYFVMGSPVVYSAYNGWKELASERLTKLKPVSIPQSVKDTTIEIVKHAKSDDEKFLAIYKYMAENFNENFSYIKEIDFTPTSLEKIQEKKYGCVRDLVAMFLAYAKVAGLQDVYPALILMPSDRFTNIQTKYALDDEIASIQIYHQGRLYHVGKDTAPFGYIGTNKANIVWGMDKIKIDTYQYSKENLEKYVYNYKISKDNTKLKVNSVVAGETNMDMRRRFLHQTENKRKIWFNNYLGLKSATLTDGPNFENFDKISEDLKFNYTLSYSDFVVKQDNYEYFKFEKPKVDIDVSKIDREYGFVLAHTINKDDKIIIELDGKFGLINPPDKASFTFSNGKGKAVFNYKTTKKGNKIIIKRKLYIPSGIVAQKDYKKFREFILALKNPLNSMVFIKK